jgi:hypothetical protein
MAKATDSILDRNECWTSAGSQKDRGVTPESEIEASLGSAFPYDFPGMVLVPQFRFEDKRRGSCASLRQNGRIA